MCLSDVAAAVLLPLAGDNGCALVRCGGRLREYIYALLATSSFRASRGPIHRLANVDVARVVCVQLCCGFEACKTHRRERMAASHAANAADAATNWHWWTGMAEPLCVEQLGVCTAEPGLGVAQVLLCEYKQ